LSNEAQSSKNQPQKLKLKMLINKQNKAAANNGMGMDISQCKGYLDSPSF
jgi:hypothetical protein